MVKLNQYVVWISRNQAKTMIKSISVKKKIMKRIIKFKREFDLNSVGFIWKLISKNQSTGYNLWEQ